MNIKSSLVSATVLGGTAFIVACMPSVFAANIGGVAIHGAVSATAAHSDQYDYYGDTDDHVDLIHTEITLNGGYRFENGLRVGAQLYAYELAGFKELTLDFANLDYSFRPEIGLRVGRNKSVSGLYNDVQDLDQVRVFASLPLSFYPRAARPFDASYDGVALYGSIAAGRVGSFDYQLSAGHVGKIGEDRPYTRGIASLSRPADLDLNNQYVAALAWNPRIDGLKLNFTYLLLPKVEQDSFLGTRAELISHGFGGLPASIDAGFGAGAWDHSGFFAGTPTRIEIKYSVTALGAEYVRDKWTLVAEYKWEEFEGENSVPAVGLVRAPVTNLQKVSYVQVVYQATDRLGLGVYYAYTHGDPENTDLNSYSTSSKDLAVAASYGLTKWWLVKVEFHRIDGLLDLGIGGNINYPIKDRRWNYLVLKSTISF